MPTVCGLDLWNRKFPHSGTSMSVGFLMRFWFIFDQPRMQPRMGSDGNRLRHRRVRANSTPWAKSGLTLFGNAPRGLRDRHLHLLGLYSLAASGRRDEEAQTGLLCCLREPRHHGREQTQNNVGYATKVLFSHSRDMMRSESPSGRFGSIRPEVQIP